MTCEVVLCAVLRIQWREWTVSLPSIEVRHEVQPQMGISAMSVRAGSMDASGLVRDPIEAKRSDLA